MLLSALDTTQVLVAVVIGLTLLQVLLAGYLLATLRASASERTALNKEMFGLLKKLEGITSSRREQMLKHYDKILQNLAVRLPTTVAAQTSAMIFDTESKILARLAELEPQLKVDESSKRKMDDLIKSMETLESTIVALTAETVHKVMIDSRRALLDDDNFSDIEIAA